jgi:hypothetical protein
MTITELDEFTRAYVEAALWSSNDESTPQGGEPLDANYTVEDIAPETLAKMVEDCRRFQADNAEDIAAGCVRMLHTCTDTEYAGHDFWLTRNGHGCGFWDGDWPDEAGERLTQAAQRYAQTDLYVGDDGLIYA